FTEEGSNANENGGALNVSVSLSGPSAFPVSVPFTVGGTAAAGADFTAPSSPLVISAGATSANLIVTLLEDDTDEPDETVIFSLGAPNGAVPGGVTEHVLTIIDND